MIYFHAWHHIIDSVLLVMYSGLSTCFNLYTMFSILFFFFSVAAAVCALRFIYYHHKDKHVVPTAFKYVNFFCICPFFFPILLSLQFSRTVCFFFASCRYVCFFAYIFFFYPHSLCHVICIPNVYIHFILNSLRMKVLCHFPLFSLCNF